MHSETKAHKTIVQDVEAADYDYVVCDCGGPSNHALNFDQTCVDTPVHNLQEEMSKMNKIKNWNFNMYVKYFVYLLLIGIMIFNSLEISSFISSICNIVENMKDNINKTKTD